MDASSRATGYASSEANYMTQEWLKECENKHKICTKPITISEFILPRRLLDIGTPGSRSPFLIETASLREKSCRYAALSHRWGDPDKLLQTLNSNIHEHYKLIPWDALSRTFQDAITVSQRLGIQYLWIDSLCIIQKDRTDFETECSSMHLIYLHSYCMIAASDALDGSEGFLQFWDDSSQLTSDNPVSAPQTSRQTAAFRPQSPDFRRNQFIKWTEWTKILDGHLNKRGWTYQERQLSPRILHFTKQGVMWECRLCIGAGDSKNLQLRRTAWGLENRRFLPQTKFFRVLDRDQSRLSIEDIMVMWLGTVQGYTDRHLSYPEDKLPALSGLAAAISTIIMERSAETPLYLAGVWVSHMHRQLFWCPIIPAGLDNGTSAWPPGKDDSFPSWSWSSSKIPVTFFYTLTRLQEISKARAQTWRESDYLEVQKLQPQRATKYLCTDITPGGSDPFGRIRGSRLEITGCFLDETVSKAKLSREDCQQYELLCGRQGQYKITVAFDFGPFLLNNLSLRFLFLLGENKTGFSWNCGIVLRSNETGHFQRIGIFSVFQSSKITDLDWNLKSGTMTLI